jgi:hypothetical protein
MVWRILFVPSLLLWALPSLANELSYTGTYTMQTQAGPLTLSLNQDAKGNVTGTLATQNGLLRLQGSEGEGEIVGTATDGKTKVYFEAELEGSELHFLLAGLDPAGRADYSQAQEMTFTRTSKAASAAPKPEHKPGKGPSAAQSPSARQPGRDPGKSSQDQQLAKLLLSSPWCSFSYSQSSGRTSTSRNMFAPDGTLHVSSSSGGGTVNQFGGSVGPSGSLYSQHAGGRQLRWKVERGQLWLDEGKGFEAMPTQLTQNSNGYPIIKAAGKEYMQCK